MEDSQKKDVELLGHKRKKSNDENEEDKEKKEENNTNKLPIILDINKKEETHINDKKCQNNQKQEENKEMSEKKNETIVNMESKKQEKGIIEEKEDLCGKCGIKKKTLSFKDIKSIFEYYSKNNAQISNVKDIQLEYKNIIFDKNKNICRNCLDDLVKDKNSFLNFIYIKEKDDKKMKLEDKKNENKINPSKLKSNNIDI